VVVILVLASSEGGLGENGLDGTSLDTATIDDHFPEHLLDLKEQQYQVPTDEINR
jgi:hypothetical protein